MTFTADTSPEVRNALGGILKIESGGDRVLYVEKDGEFTPVATVARYPGCPVELYEAVIESLKGKRYGD